MSGASSSSFVQRVLRVTFRLGQVNGTQPTFQGSGGANQLTLSGLRCSAAITQTGGISQGALDLRIYGMTESQMNQLSQVQGAPIRQPPGNSVTVEAGTAAGLSQVYAGTINGAFIDYTGSPQVPLHVLGLAAYEAAVKAVPPSSYKGGADVAVIMGNLAKTMGFQYENNSINGIILSNSYFPGSAYQQAQACANAAGIEMTVDNGTLAIWPRDGSRGGSVPLISPGTGMKGYPVQTLTGIELETLFNPSVKFGSRVQVQSSRQTACGTWKVIQLSTILESETPDGAWFQRLTLVPVTFF